MKLTVIKEDILQGLKTVTGILPEKTGAAFLRTIWIRTLQDAVRIEVTDGSLEFCGEYPARVDAPGFAGVFGAEFCNLIQKMPSEEITLELTTTNDTGDTGEDKALLVKQGRRRYQLPVTKSEWYQEFAARPEKTVPLQGVNLPEVIDCVAFCVAQNAAHGEASTCASFLPKETGLEVFGMDGHQCALLTLQNPALQGLLPDEGAQIFREYLLKLQKWLKGLPKNAVVHAGVEQMRLFLLVEDTREQLSLPLSAYPVISYQILYDKLEASDAVPVVLNRTALLGALERLGLFVKEGFAFTFFSFARDGLQLSLTEDASDNTVEELEATLSDAPEQTIFPVKSLSAILKHFNSETVQLTLTGARGPCGIQDPEEPGYNVLIMPVNLENRAAY